jgi:hypothetical protein
MKTEKFALEEVLLTLILVIVTFLLLASAGSVWAGMALNAAVTPDTIKVTICVPGYTKTIRPPVSYTNKVKYHLMDLLHIPVANAHLYELDHIVPLTLGGNPSSPDNLMLQLWTGPQGALAKDKLEPRLSHLVCQGKLELLEAQECIFTDWEACNLKHPATTGSRK